MPLAPLKNRANPRESKKTRAIKRAKYAGGILAALVLLVGAVALLYIWLQPPEKKTDTATDPQATKPPTLQAPRKLGENVPFGSSIQSLTSRVAPGENASVTLRSLEGAVCSIKVIRLDSFGKEVEKVDDSGLNEKTADDFGVTTWTWTMPQGATKGPWVADITCVRGDKSTRSTGDITVGVPQ